jgi:hypothetical protein
MLNTPDPAQQAAQQLQMQGAQATIQKTQAEAQKLTADAGKAQTAGLLNLAKAHTQGSPGAPEPPKTPLDLAQQLADINETNATAQHKRAAAETMQHKALLSPLQIIADHAQRAADRGVNDHHRTQDRLMEDFHRSRDREVEAQQQANALDQGFGPPSGA